MIIVRFFFFQEFLRSAYKGFVPQEVISSSAAANQLKPLSGNVSCPISSNNNNNSNNSSGQLTIDRKRVVESMSEDVYSRKGQNELAWPKATPGQIRY